MKLWRATLPLQVAIAGGQYRRTPGAREVVMQAVGLRRAPLILAGCGATAQTGMDGERAIRDSFESEDYFVVIAKSGDTRAWSRDFLAMPREVDRELQQFINDFARAAGRDTESLASIAQQLYVTVHGPK